MFQTKIDTTELEQQIARLWKTRFFITENLRPLVRALVNYAKERMQFHCRPRTFRSTGRLRASIRASRIYRVGKFGLMGYAYVPREIKYKFASEFGFKVRREKAIKGKPVMKFHWVQWINAPLDVIQKYALPHGGYFFFRRVARGVYRGLYFTQKAFMDVQVRSLGFLQLLGEKLKISLLR